MPTPEVGRPVAPTITPVSSATIVTELDVSGRAEGHAHDGGPGPVRRRAPERRHGAARDRRRAGADRPDAPTRPSPSRSSDAGVQHFLGRTVLRSRAQRQDVPPQPRAVQGGHAPGAVLGPRRAGDPDHRPRPRHVLARPRRRDGRRAGRLRLRPAASTSRAAATCARSSSAPTSPRACGPRSTASTSRTRERTVYRAQRHRCPASSSTTTRSPSTTAICAWPPPRSRSGSPTAAATREPEHGHRARRSNASRLDPRRLGHRARQGRAHLRRALHGRHAATSSRSARSTRCTRSTSPIRRRRRWSAS